MITRDGESNIIIPREDCPPLAGILAMFKTDLEDRWDDIPGSIRPALQRMLDCAEAIQTAIGP